MRNEAFPLVHTGLAFAVLSGSNIMRCAEDFSVLLNTLQVNHQIEALLLQQQQLQARRNNLLRELETNKRAPKANWAGSFEWDEKATHALNSVFKLKSFRLATCIQLAMYPPLPRLYDR